MSDDLGLYSVSGEAIDEVDRLRAEVDRLKAKRARLLQFAVDAKVQIDRLKAELDRANDHRHGMIASLEQQVETLRTERALERNVRMRLQRGLTEAAQSLGIDPDGLSDSETLRAIVDRGL